MYVVLMHHFDIGMCGDFIFLLFCNTCSVYLNTNIFLIGVEILGNLPLHLHCHVKINTPDCTKTCGITELSYRVFTCMYVCVRMLPFQT